MDITIFKLLDRVQHVRVRVRVSEIYPDPSQSDMQAIATMYTHIQEFLGIVPSKSRFHRGNSPSY